MGVRFWLGSIWGMLESQGTLYSPHGWTPTHITKAQGDTSWAMKQWVLGLLCHCLRR